MALDRVPSTELVLDTIQKANNQLLTWLAVGFVCGFVFGALLAVFMVSLR